MRKKILESLCEENKPLYYFGWLNLLAFVGCILGLLLVNIEVLGIHALIKPSKFFISTTIFSWTMLWYLRYLPNKKANNAYSWMVILVFSYENIYILYRAVRGELSHFNVTTAITGQLYILMGIVITILAVWTAIIAVRFIRLKHTDLSPHYKLSIILGIIIFFIYSFQGFMMVAQLKHTVGAPDGGEGITYLNWNKAFGDLRIAHFFGIHALQLIPLISYFWLKKRGQVVALSVVYFGFIAFLLYMALQEQSPF